MTTLYELDRGLVRSLTAAVVPPAGRGWPRGARVVGARVGARGSLCAGAGF
jgi:hypothetical protein